jgi:hypothetical protein
MPGTTSFTLCSSCITSECESTLKHYFVTKCIFQSMCMDQVFTESMLMEIWTGACSNVHVCNTACIFLSVDVSYNCCILCHYDIRGVINFVRIVQDQPRRFPNGFISLPPRYNV